MSETIRVSVLVKALNEQEKIARCLESILGEVADLQAEVILADSNSDDATIAIARAYPVKIVQFASESDRSCGAAAQLAYQCSRGEFVLMIDGDMELQKGFLRAALAHLQSNPDVAGVGGILVDTLLTSPAARRRLDEYMEIGKVVEVDHLGGGGLYRRDAIDSVGYFANRWLKACEELDLGLRLYASGWKLMRLPIRSVDHSGYDESGADMLARLFRNGRLAAYGVFLRHSIGRPWFRRSLKAAWFAFVAPVVYGAGALIALILFALGIGVIPAIAFGFILPWLTAAAALYLKKRRVADVAHALAAWHVYSAAAVPSFFRPIRDPLQPIPFKDSASG